MSTVTAAVGTAAAHAGRWVLLADPTDVGDETDKAGPLAIVVIIVLCVACFFLFRSMSRHLRRVREEFPAAPEDTAAPGPEQGTVHRAADPGPDDRSGTGEPLRPASRSVPKARSRTGTDTHGG